MIDANVLQKPEFCVIEELNAVLFFLLGERFDMAELSSASDELNPRASEKTMRPYRILKSFY